MVIKVNVISSSHGHNAVQYAMAKKGGNNETPTLLDTTIQHENIMLNDIDPTTAWQKMKLHQDNSGHKVKDGFFRIEICPTKEESQGWSLDDWRKLLNDAIRTIDKTDYRDKAGKVKGKHSNIANSQYVATIHHDTDNTHIHLIVNRIDNDGKLQDANRCQDRGFLAANTIALERGWIKAEDITCKRKERIHKDAINVLRNMDSFNLNKYFSMMRANGWIIDAKYDSNGVCRGYSIGEQLYHKDGSKSSVMLYQASKLGHGRDLMVSRLNATWNKLHPHTQAIEKPMPKVVTPTASVTTSTPRDVVAPKRVPIWSCSEHTQAEEWWQDGQTTRIPNVVYDTINKEIPAINKMDYKDPDEEIPVKTDIVAVAIFEFLMAADARVPAGGGGGSSSDLRWDGLNKDDLEKMAKGAAHTAFAKCTSGLRKRGISY